MGSVSVLNDLRIAAPCPVAWDDMRGDTRVRFCGLCSKHVYNLSELSGEEARTLIEAAEGHLCVRLYRRGDGTVLTSDCPVGLRSMLRRRLLRLATTGVVLFASLRSGLWFYAHGDSLSRIPVAPAGNGVTISDWVDWAASVLGIKAPSTQVTMGLPCLVMPAGTSGAAIPEISTPVVIPDDVFVPDQFGPG